MRPNVEVVQAFGGGTMDSIGSASSVSCTMCHDRGFSRNPKYFFYGVCLIACGALMFFQWTPAPRAFTTIWGFVAQFGLPDFVGTGLICTLTAFPPLYGAWFIIVWCRQGICPLCRMWPRRSVGRSTRRRETG